MNEERAIKLYDAITAVREDYIEDAFPGEKVRRRIPRRTFAAIAACLCLILGGGIYLIRTSGGTGLARRDRVPGEAYMSYAGPIMPLTAEGEPGDLTLTRKLELDLADFPEKQTCRVTDAYTLRNAGAGAETVTLLYPFAENLLADPELIRSLTVNGEAAAPELTIGSSIPEVRAEWTKYFTPLQTGSLTLPDPSPLLSRPVTVYELRDCWAEESDDGANPTLSLEFTMGRERSAVLSWRFNGGSDDSASGQYSRMRSFREAPGQSAYLIVLGEDIHDPVLRAYRDGACETPTEKAGGTVLRWESTLGEMLALCCRDMQSWQPESTLEKQFSDAELAAACTAFAMEQGYFALRPYTAVRNFMLEDILLPFRAWRRILLLRFTVTVPAGESLEIVVETVKEASFDYGAGAGSMMGFDALALPAGALPAEEETVTLRLPEGVVCRGQDLTPAEGKYRYWLDVQRKWK